MTSPITPRCSWMEKSDLHCGQDATCNALFKDYTGTVYAERPFCAIHADTARNTKPSLEMVPIR